MVERSISVQALTVAIVLPLLTVGASFGLAYLAAWSSRASNPDADGFGIAAVFMLTFFATYVVTAPLLVRFLLLEGRRLGPGLITLLAPFVVLIPLAIILAALPPSGRLVALAATAVPWVIVSAAIITQLLHKAAKRDAALAATNESAAPEQSSKQAASQPEEQQQRWNQPAPRPER
jgi:hypothetical protein